MQKNKNILAYILILLPLVLSIYFFINLEPLIPRGYELAIDAYVISKTLLFVLSLYLLSKLGYFIINKKD